MRPGFRSDLEGLRGLAILLVVAFHAGVSWLSGGFVGVDVFFVLSGYLITGALARELVDTGHIDRAAFFARRARRLLPTFFVILLATLGIAVFLYAPIDVPSIASDARAVALQYGNVLFAQQSVDYHRAAGNPLLHTWSLAVEQQFYVVWPLLFALIARIADGTDESESFMRRRVVVAIVSAALVSFVASLFITRTAQPWAFFTMPTRLWEFALGGLAALVLNPAARLPRGVLLQIVGLVAVGIASFTYGEALPYPGFYALLPVIGAVAIVLGGQVAPESVVSRALSSAPLQWLGRMSYAWYLWHWPLVGLGAVLDWKIGVAGKLAWSVVALGLAVLTNRFVEEPMRHATTVDDAPHRLNLVAIGGAALAAGIAWLVLAGSQQRIAASPAQRTFAAARVDGMPHDCWGSLTENATAPCIFGDVSASTTVVLMGDSHAEHWLAAMDRLGRERHWKVYAMVKPACPVADLPRMVNARLKRFYTECGDWRARKIQRILTLRPDFVVLSSYDHYVATQAKASSWNVSPAAWEAGLRNTYRTIAGAGIRTIAMRDVPDVGFNVPGCLSRQASGAPFQIRPCRYDLGASLHPEAVAAQTRAAVGIDRLAFVSMNDQVCAVAPCRVVEQGAIVYKDDDHLTATFSRRVAPVLGDRIEAALRTLR